MGLKGGTTFSLKKNNAGIIELYLLEHNGQETGLAGIQFGSKDVQEQTVIATACRLGADASKLGGINTVVPTSSDRSRGSETTLASRGLSITDTIETETVLVTKTGQTTEAGLDCDSTALGVGVGAECREGGVAGSLVVDGCNTLGHGQDTAGSGGVVTVVDVELSRLSGVLREHLLDRGKGMILDGVKLLTQLFTVAGTKGSGVVIREEDEGVLGTTNFEIVLGKDLDAAEGREGGFGGFEKGRVGNSGVGGFGGDQNLGDNRLHRGNCQQAGEDEYFH